jgi:hypothetical protein
VTDPTPPPAPAPPALTEDQTSGGLFVRWNAGSLALGLAALTIGWFAAQRTPPERVDPVGLAADAGWDDGLAEVARYRATRTIYDQPREYELVRVAVKEPWDPLQDVKRDGGVDAFKTVAVHEVPTGKPYEYRQTLFVHVARSDARRLLSLTMGSQEWCGNTFVRWRVDGGGLRRAAHSYWDGEADWSDDLPGDVWAEDQLAFTVRALDPAAPPFEADLLPTTLGNKAPRTRPTRARVSVGAQDEEVVAPAGTFRCARFDVTAGERTLRYWVATGAPRRPLIRYEDGTGAGVLASLERAAYWEKK